MGTQSTWAIKVFLGQPVNVENFLKN